MKVSDLWLEFMVGGMCSLCGQSGIIDTRGIRTPAKFECGGLHYCICPNGRALKKHGANKLDWLTQVRPLSAHYTPYQVEERKP